MPSTTAPIASPIVPRTSIVTALCASLLKRTAAISIIGVLIAAPYVISYFSKSGRSILPVELLMSAKNTAQIKSKKEILKTSRDRQFNIQLVHDKVNKSVAKNEEHTLTQYISTNDSKRYEAIRNIDSFNEGNEWQTKSCIPDTDLTTKTTLCFLY